MGDDSLPLVSIVIPVFNQERFVELAVQSALQQNYSALEVIASDDASTDSSGKILSDLATKHAPLKVIIQEQNLGIAKHISWILGQGKGKYIVRLDSDDCLKPNYVRELVHLLESNASAAYAHGAIQEIDEDNKVKRLRSLNRSSGFQCAEESLRSMASGYRVAANIIMYRRAALEETVFNDFEVNFAEDWYLAVKLASQGWGNVYTSSIVASYRVWSDCAQLRPRRKIAELKGIIAVFEKGLLPAFQSRQWSVQPLHRELCLLSINHSVTLDSPIWSAAEREEMKSLLCRMSSHPVQSVCLWLVEHRGTFLIRSFFESKHLVKSFLKRLLKR